MASHFFQRTENDEMNKPLNDCCCLKIRERHAQGMTQQNRRLNMLHYTYIRKRSLEGTSILDTPVLRGVKKWLAARSSSSSITLPKPEGDSEKVAKAFRWGAGSGGGGGKDRNEAQRSPARASNSPMILTFIKPRLPVGVTHGEKEHFPGELLTQATAPQQKLASIG